MAVEEKTNLVFTFNVLKHFPWSEGRPELSDMKRHGFFAHPSPDIILWAGPVKEEKNQSL